MSVQWPRKLTPWLLKHVLLINEAIYKDDTKVALEEENFQLHDFDCIGIADMAKDGRPQYSQFHMDTEKTIKFLRSRKVCHCHDTREY